MQFVDIIHDPIYGLAPITGIERQILATRKMHRARRIKQLGLVSLTYPGANHTRFEHSIGVMHLTSALLDEFARRGEASISDHHRQNIRLAALLHDVGHGPFSHTFEEATKVEIGFDHEAATYDIMRRDRELAHILGRRANVIIHFLEGDSIGPVPGEIITGDIGTDRMDYLIRDTYYTGLGHRPDLSSLVASVRLVSDRSKKRLAVEPENLSSVELLSTTRYHHFAMIAHREECRAREFLLIKAIARHIMSIPVARRRTFFAQMFAEFDDNELIFRLKSKVNPFMQMLDEGKTLTIPYKIRLGDIRSGLAKYCLYRLHDSPSALREFCSAMSRRISSLVRREVFVDLNLWKHQVSDLVSHRSSYETETDRFSTLLNDESFLLRDIAGAQVLSSTLAVYATPISSQALKALSHELVRERKTLLSAPILSGLTRRLIRNNGLTSADEVLILLHSLNDYYTDLLDNERIEGPRIIPYLRGITRLTDIAHACIKRIGKPTLQVKEFWPRGAMRSFKYSPKLFSTLNALHHLSIIELAYVPERDPEKRRYSQTYFLRVKERTIRQNLFGDTHEYRNLSRQYFRVFKSDSLDERFERFYADENKKIIGGPSSRAWSSYPR